MIDKIEKEVDRFATQIFPTLDIGRMNQLIDRLIDIKVDRQKELDGLAEEKESAINCEEV